MPPRHCSNDAQTAYSFPKNIENMKAVACRLYPIVLMGGASSFKPLSHLIHGILMALKVTAAIVRTVSVAGADGRGAKLRAVEGRGFAVGD